MDIIEVKNNLVKLSYEDNLSLSGLILIKDDTKNYIAQILHLESVRAGKIAVAKILFNYKDGIFAYDGSIPSLRANVENFSYNEFEKHLDISNPITLGKIPSEKSNLQVGFDFLKENPIILSEKFYVTKVLLNNLAIQLQARKEKIIVFDTVGMFKNNKISLSKDFKLPLNAQFVDYIYDNEFADATNECKALAQAVFEELRYYSQTVDFIPFDTFKSVVDSEFARTKLFQMIALKNKIKQIGVMEIFAQKAEEYKVLAEKTANASTLVIDISKFKPALQKECIKYVYSLLKNIDAEFYSFTHLTSDTSDEILLKELVEVENVHTTIICDYNYANLNKLKKCSKNIFMFSPLKQQKDYGGYNVMLQRLAEDEFIAYGKMTKFVPVICKMTQVSQADIIIPHSTDAIKNETQEIQNPEQPQITPETQNEEITNNEQTEEIKSEEITEGTAVSDSAQQPEEPEDITEIISDTEEVNDNDENLSQEQNIVDETDYTETEEVQLTAEPVHAEEDVQSDTDNISENVQDEITIALNEVPDIEDDDELSDDDLDMIEKLSKPDEEINIINNTEPVSENVADSMDINTNEPVISETDAGSNEIQIKTESEDLVNRIDEAENNEINNTEELNAEIPAEDEVVIENNTEAEPPAEDNIELEANTVSEPPVQNEPLQMRTNTVPVVPEYKADFPDEDRVNSDRIGQGDRVYHEEFGEGVVEKMINYGDKLLCSINFTNVGRRLLNPDISEMKKI